MIWHTLPDLLRSAVAEEASPEQPRAAELLDVLAALPLAVPAYRRVLQDAGTGHIKSEAHEFSTPTYSVHRIQESQCWRQQLIMDGLLMRSRTRRPKWRSLLANPNPSPIYRRHAMTP